MNGSTHVIAENRTDISKREDVVDNRVNLKDLYPGASYTVSLWYELDSERLPQCSHSLTLCELTCSVLDCAAERLMFIIISLFYYPSVCLLI